MPWHESYVPASQMPVKPWKTWLRADPADLCQMQCQQWLTVTRTQLLSPQAGLQLTGRRKVKYGQPGTQTTPAVDMSITRASQGDQQPQKSASSHITASRQQPQDQASSRPHGSPPGKKSLFMPASCSQSTIHIKAKLAVGTGSPDNSYHLDPCVNYKARRRRSPVRELWQPASCSDCT